MGEPYPFKKTRQTLERAGNFGQTAALHAVAVRDGAAEL